MEPDFYAPEPYYGHTKTSSSSTSRDGSSPPHLQTRARSFSNLKAKAASSTSTLLAKGGESLSNREGWERTAERVKGAGSKLERYSGASSNSSPMRRSPEPVPPVPKRFQDGGSLSPLPPEQTQMHVQYQQNSQPSGQSSYQSSVSSLQKLAISGAKGLRSAATGYFQSAGQTPPPGAVSSNSSGGYFSSSRKEAKKIEREREEREWEAHGGCEEEVILFPGFAHLEAGAGFKLTCTVHGFAQQLRPLSSLTRAQRIALGVMRSVAALPKIGSAGTEVEIEEDPPDLSITSASDLASGRNPTANAKDQTFAALLQEEEDRMSSRSGSFDSMSSYEQEEAEIIKRTSTILGGKRNNRKVTQEPEALLEDPTPVIPPKPHAFRQRDLTPPNPFAWEESTSPPRPVPPNVQVQSASPTATPVNLNPISNSPTPTKHHHLWVPKGSEIPDAHSALTASLRPFFARKLTGEIIDVEIWGRYRCEELGPEGKLGKKPLTRFGLLTAPYTGAVRERIEIALEEGLELDLIGIRIFGTLIESLPSHLHADIPKAVAPIPLTTTPIRIGKTASIDIPIRFVDLHSPHVLVISDLDDTVKETYVLSGMRTVLRQAMVRHHSEIAVPGMVQWYRAMENLGNVSFAYVSNSPYESWKRLEMFMEVLGFPRGGVALKDYGSGSSILSKLWEEAGARKRESVEMTLREFPGSRLILVGDSGEGDLELYVNVAQGRPHEVAAIFIRDVTTTHILNSGPARTPSPTPPPTPPPASPPSSSSRPPILSPQVAPPPVAHLVPSKPSVPPRAPPTRSDSATSLMSRSASPYAPIIPPRPTPPSTTQTHFDHVNRVEFSSPDGRSAESLTSGPISNQPRAISGRPVDRGRELSDGQRQALQVWHARVRKAEQSLPKGVLLKVFRTGDECEDLAIRLIKSLEPQR